jgi:hypothetical protein
MENQKDLTKITESCGQAFYAVCDCVMTDAQMKEWGETGNVLPDDCMDANMTLHDIIINHGLDVFDEDGQMNGDAEIILEDAWKFADKLNKKKYPKPPSYSIGDLHSSINDIFNQWVSAKMTSIEARDLANKCCAKFLEDNK